MVAARVLQHAHLLQRLNTFSNNADAERLSEFNDCLADALAFGLDTKTL
jgi:hypothetical protein